VGVVTVVHVGSAWKWETHALVSLQPISRHLKSHLWLTHLSPCLWRSSQRTEGNDATLSEANSHVDVGDFSCLHLFRYFSSYRNLFGASIGLRASHQLAVWYSCHSWSYTAVTFQPPTRADI